MAEFNLSITVFVWILVLTLVLLAMFFASRYHKFKPNEYILHLRNGKIKTAGRGGKVIKLPLIDEIVVIPTTTRKTLLNSGEKIVSREYQPVAVVAILYWRVSDPKVAFNAVVWDPRSSDYVERVLSTATEAIIRTTCAALPIEKIIRERTEIIKMITDQLLNLTSDWGIIIESLEIIEAQILDDDLKSNMEAVKSIEEQKRARLARANAEEIYRVRELEVRQQVGSAEQQTEEEIALKQKHRERAISEENKEIVNIQSETESLKRIIQAKAEAESLKLMRIAEAEAEAQRVYKQMDANAQGVKRKMEADAEGVRLKNAADADGIRLRNAADAEGIKLRMEAEADGIKKRLLAEADGIRAKKLAEAEGIHKIVEALNLADENYLASKFIENMPQVFKSLSPEKMIVMGEGNQSFNSIFNSIVPLMELLPMFSEKMKNGIKNLKDNPDATKTATSPVVKG